MSDTIPAPPRGHSHVFLGVAHEASERRTWAVIWLCGAMMAALPLFSSRPEATEAEVLAVGHGLAVHGKPAAGRRRGRTSGREYETPIHVEPSADGFLISLPYGPGADWVQNVLAGTGLVVRRGRTYPLLDPRIADADTVPGLSRAGRQYGRLAGKVLLAELGVPEPGFGRGPAASS